MCVCVCRWRVSFTERSHRTLEIGMSMFGGKSGGGGRGGWLGVGVGGGGPNFETLTVAHSRIRRIKCHTRRILK